MSYWVAYSANTSTQETPRYMSVAPAIAIHVLKKGSPFNKPHTDTFIVWPNASGHLFFFPPRLLPLSFLLFCRFIQQKKTNTPLLAWFWFTIGCDVAVVLPFFFLHSFDSYLPQGLGCRRVGCGSRCFGSFILWWFFFWRLVSALCLLFSVPHQSM